MTLPLGLTAITPAENIAYHNEIDGRLPGLALPTNIISGNAGHLGHHETLAGYIGDGLDLDLTEGEPGHIAAHNKIHAYLDNTASKLYWPPPTGYAGFQTMNVPTGGGTLNLTAGQDYRLVMPASPVTKRVRVSGGRHVVVIGGEVDIDTTNGGNGDDDNAWDWNNQTGTIHIEGIYMHGAVMNDAVKGTSYTVWQVQNCRIGGPTAGEGLVGTQAGYHCDGWQPFGGVTEFRVDKVSIYSQFQGGMIKADGNHWLTTNLRRVLLSQHATPDSTARTVNIITGGPNPDGFDYVEGPINLGDELYLIQRSTTANSSISPAAWFTNTGSADARIYTPVQPNAQGITFTGVIRETAPTSRTGGSENWAPTDTTKEFCPAGVAGIGYVSPGYLT
jgi:hypothetical protein